MRHAQLGDDSLDHDLAANEVPGPLGRDDGLLAAGDRAAQKGDSGQEEQPPRRLFANCPEGDPPRPAETVKPGTGATKPRPGGRTRQDTLRRAGVVAEW